MPKYYAVKRGRTMGVYDTWTECKANVNGYKGAVFKSFPTKQQANDFVWGMNDNTCNTNSNTYSNTTTTSTISTMKNPKKRKKIKSEYVIQIEDKLFNDINTKYVFVDGSFQKRGNGGIGGYGVYFGKNSPYNLSCRVKNPTNNICELLAILNVLKILKRNRETIPKERIYIIISDSEYSICALTLWYKKWEKNNWLTTGNKDVKNKEIIQLILDLMKQVKNIVNIKFYHQYSHQRKPSDIESLEYILWYGNDMADKLAKGEIRPSYLPLHKDHTKPALVSDIQL